MVTIGGVEIPTTYEEAVQVLADAHGAHHGPDTEIYRCNSPEDAGLPETERVVRLLEVNGRFPSAGRGELRATGFGRARDFPFRSSVILASPDDVARLGRGELRLPSGWHFDLGRRVWPS